MLLTGCDRMTRDDWYKALPALRALPRVVLDEGGETVRWLAQFLPGTMVSVVNAQAPNDGPTKAASKATRPTECKFKQS